MKFKSNNQRKAMFAKINSGAYVESPELKIKGTYIGINPKGYAINTYSKGRTKILYTKYKPEIIKIPKSAKTMTYNELKKRGIILKFNDDADGDGVINIKDCRPLNSAEQGFIHDLISKAGGTISKTKDKINEFKEEMHERKIQNLHEKEERLEVENEKQQKIINDKLDALRLKNSIRSKELSIKAEKANQITAMVNALKEEKLKQQKIEQQINETNAKLEEGTIKGKLKSASKFVGKRALMGSQMLSDDLLGTKFKPKKKRKTKKRKAGDPGWAG